MGSAVIAIGPMIFEEYNFDDYQRWRGQAISGVINWSVFDVGEHSESCLGLSILSPRLMRSRLNTTVSFLLAAFRILVKIYGQASKASVSRMAPAGMPKGLV